jgi:predicted small integral membrane protein
MLKNSAWKPIWTTLFPLSILFIIIALLLTSMARSGDAREDGRSFSNPERPDIPYKTTSEDRLQFASRSSQPSGLIAIHAKSGPMISTTESSWMDIPQMRGRVTIKEFSLLAVTFYSDTNVSADKRLFARA